MKQLHIRLKTWILEIVDFFYPPFKKFVPLQVFRYAVCGGANLLLSIVLFFVFFHWVVNKEYIPLHWRTFSFVVSPHTAALLLAFIVCTPIGFYLNLFVVFPGSHLRRRAQLMRYTMVSVLNLILNYILLKFLVEKLHIYPTIANILNTTIVVTLTYILQRHFSFRKKKNNQSV
jgi:putative flippase GtrA